MKRRSRKQIEEFDYLNPGLRTLDFLCSECDGRGELVHAIATSADSHTTLIIREAFVHLLYNKNFKLTPKEIKKLARYRRALRVIAEARHPVKCKRLLNRFIRKYNHRVLLYFLDCARKRMKKK